MNPIVSLVVTPVLVFWVLGQVRKPSGPLGKRFVTAMNLSHAGLTDWGLTHVEMERDATILDIGCGGGRTVERLAQRAPEGVVYGIDYSAASVAASRRKNTREIAEGRVHIELANVAALPFPDRIFDLVTAVETHYYWPDLDANMREVFRVVKPGGTFALIAETHRGGTFHMLYGLVMRLLRAAYLSDAEHRELLTQAGFAEVTTDHAKGTSWICATGRRPG